MLQYEVLTGDDARRGNELLPLCGMVFEDFAPAYLTDRLSHVADPCLVTARFANGSLAAFKLGYRRGTTLFYSWLGGVHPHGRRQGIARELTTRQHDLARSLGYEQVETRTRARNSAMLILNIEMGFRICGFESGSGGHDVVLFRKRL